jgi:hypothetical protein
MTQTTQRNSLLGQEAYRNPRHEQEAAALQAHDDATNDSQGQAELGDAASEQPVHDWEKRYKDLQSFNSRKINELTNQIKTLQTQGVPKVQAPRTPEEMAAFKEANPEMYGVIQHMATEIAQSQLTTYDQQMADVQNDLLDTKMQRAELAIKAAHPDFEQIINSDKFAVWASTQSKDVQDWIYNNPNNPDLAIKALSLYKYESGHTQAVDTPAAAMDIQSPAGTGTETNSRNHPAYIWKESEIRKMSPQDFAKWDESIKLAQHEGRIAVGQ